MTPLTRAQKWNEMPYAALLLIVLFNGDCARDVAGALASVCKRWRDLVVNYCPTDMWRNFYQNQLLRRHDMTHRGMVQANIFIDKTVPAETFSAFSSAAGMCHDLVADARSLLSVFKSYQDGGLPASWKRDAPAMMATWEGTTVVKGRLTKLDLVYAYFSPPPPNHDAATRARIDLRSFRRLSCLVHLRLESCSLRGRFDDYNNHEPLSSLFPPTLRVLIIKNNNFSGSTVDLTTLPVRLVICSLAGDNLYGHNMDLTKLPAGLEELDLSGNDFSWSVNLSKLPASCRTGLSIRPDGPVRTGRSRRSGPSVRPSERPPAVRTVGPDGVGRSDRTGRPEAGRLRAVRTERENFSTFRSLFLTFPLKTDRITCRPDRPDGTVRPSDLDGPSVRPSVRAPPRRAPSGRPSVRPSSGGVLDRTAVRSGRDRPDGWTTLLSDGGSAQEQVERIDVVE